MVGDKHHQAIRPLLLRPLDDESSGQHQFTLTLVPPLLTCTEQSTG
jgi:hypothetical protein